MRIDTISNQSQAIREWNGQGSRQDSDGVEREDFLDYLDRRPIALETIDESPEYDIHEWAVNAHVATIQCAFVHWKVDKGTC